MLNAIVLLIILLRVFLQHRAEHCSDSGALHPVLFPLPIVGISAVIGLSSGLIGIGGGIVLGPILYLAGMSYQRIPIVTAIYIFINSLAGILARLPDFTASLAEGSLLRENILALVLLPLASALSSILTMRFIVYRVNSRQVKLLVMATIALIAIYNMIRLVLSYG